MLGKGRGATERVLDFLTSEPLRIRSFLRLALIVLIALLVSLTHTAHWLSGVFVVIMSLYALIAVIWMIAVLNVEPPPRWFAGASTITDVIFVFILCVVSGGATIWLLPIFFLLPISVVFLDSPLSTAALTLTGAAGYLLAWFVYAVRDQMVKIPGVVYVQVGCLLWLAAALTALSFTLKRREAREQVLLEVRRRLVSEAMQADERHSRELSEQLHDGPLQNLLAARLDLEDLRANPTDEGFDRLDATLRESAAALRTTVSSLHPQVLDQVGLSAAVGDLVTKFEDRWGIATDVDIDDVGQPGCRAIIFRAARELLANVAKHAQARIVHVDLHRSGDVVTLRVADDGGGFDPEVLARRVAEGHIGLASLVVGIGAMGGSVEVDTAPGAGTSVTVSMSDEPAHAADPLKGGTGLSLPVPAPG